MTKSLIIVESPTKIKTLKHFVGPKYAFASSFGHIRDLPESAFGVDVENGFEPTYVLIPDKAKVIATIKKAAATCDEVLLAPDPDREGEAIAWHIAAILPKGTVTKRITFNAITKDAVQEALKKPTTIDMALVNAQQARRLLDRLVGYSISPLLNRRLRRGKGRFVSAGRVQSAALKIIVDRERAIEAFKPQEYWTLTAQLSPEAATPFKATLISIDSIRVEREIVPEKREGIDYCLITSEGKATQLAIDLKKSDYVVRRVERKEKRRNPEAPFITSTLQQEASRHFRFAPAHTMRLAQQLYEGIDLGPEGAEGLITYMRTDSVRIAPEAVDAARSYILSTYGNDYLHDTVRQFQVKKSAQDAHEAIRPTHIEYHPDAIKAALTEEQHKLYSLIWKRFVATQMAQAVYDTASIDIAAGTRFLLRATGSILKFPGFLALYEEQQDESEEAPPALPDLHDGDPLTLLQLDTTQSFTKPPPRFSEASLIKELERSGIGRPSTYATIMNKIQSREYTAKLQGRLKPTELGRVITEMLEQNFANVVDIGFTAEMEDHLEQIAESKEEWKDILMQFWTGFKSTLDQAIATATVPKVTTDMVCPKCGGETGAHLQKIWAQDAYFLGCERYPDCDYRSSLAEAEFNREDYAEDFNWEQACPICQSAMKVRFGRFGPFLGCVSYPECKGLVNIPKKGETVLPQEHIACPATGCTGHLIQKRSRFGKLFLMCSEFPACDVIGPDVDKIRVKYEGREKTKYSKPTRRPSMATKKAAKKAPAKKAAKKTAKR